MAQVDVDDVDLILMCTSTPDDVFGCAPQVQKALGCRRNPLAYDITAACSRFILGLVSASCHIKAGGIKNVRVIGADAISRIVDWTNRGTCILFGDSAGAVLVQCVLCQSHLSLLLQKPVSLYLALIGYCSISKQATGVLLVLIMVMGYSKNKSITQANQRILHAVSTRMQIPSEQVISNLANYGNTSAASIPLALDEAVRSGKVKPGHTIAAASFGAGLTWASTIFRWG